MTGETMNEYDAFRSAEYMLAIELRETHSRDGL